MAFSEADWDKPSIKIDPITSMADEKLSITLSGFKPNTPISIRATTLDDSNIKWESQAVIQTDEEECADLSTSEPITRTYTEPDAMGLFWSMKPIDVDKPSVFNKDSVKPIQVTVTAEQYNTIIATGTSKRLFISPETNMKEVNDHGLAGKYFEPTED